ncbi:hypothetical protein LAWI1_G001043 [Lachnellula willkommii]|uniref:Small secreted protein n=1 Tax=Lachnellula willkommii TaxID=215461 RepID=A0A559MK22_9HELO|nr:hypothetical protein LAWI1_G001043 [Lachnellula willkommii]
MHFSFATVSLALFALSLASPVPVPKKAAATSSASTAAATSKAAKASASSTSAATGSAGASVLTASTYNDIQISGGTAGTAETEANALFSKIDQTNLAGVSAADLAVIKATHDAAEDAETSAFNPAVAAASGDAATALTNGKIKNKVLKLTAEVLGIQIDAAQGGDGSDLAAEQAKLTNNIKLDTAANGQASTAVPFDATT